MLNRYWYDKIASAEEAAALAAENAMTEDAMAANAMAANEDAAAAIEEDIAIAEAVSESDLPTEVKVAIMEDHDVAPEIIEEVINADAVEKVSSFYGINPYWLSDKLAAKKSGVSQADYNKLKGDYEGLSRQLKDSEARAQAIYGDKMNLAKANKAELDRLSKELAGSKDQYSYLMGRYSDQLGKYNEQARALEEATMGQRALEAKNAEITRRLGDFQGEVKSLRNKYNGASERLNSATETIKQLEGNLASSKALSDRYAKGVRNVVGKNKQLLGQMKKMKGGLYGLGTLAALGLAGTGYGLYKANEAERPWYQKIMG